ncbi:MAG: hypothetical protein HFH01_02545 [Dorea sp.]|nr:hypothetical protein [Dorea sp.]
MRTHITPRERQRIRNRKRRQQVKRQLYLCGVLVTLLVVLVATYNSKAAEKKAALEAAKKEQKEQREQVSDDAAKKMEESALGTVADNETPKQRLKRVREQARQSGYPEDITSLLKKNKETVDFVEHFAENKNTAPARTVADDLKKGEIPQYLQWDERWGHASYGTGFIASCGCGPTAMSMVIAGLTGDATVTPVKVARYSEKNGYIDENNNTYWELMSKGGEHWGVKSFGGDTSEDFIAKELKAGHPIICSVGPGDFTKKGHFIVLTKYKNGKVKVNDPFSQKNSDKLWKYSKIKDQIKSLWVYKTE